MVEESKEKEMKSSPEMSLPPLLRGDQKDRIETQARPELKPSLFIEEPSEKSKWPLILTVLFVLVGGIVGGWFIVDAFFSAPPLSATSLTVISSPDQAEVYVNDQLRGKTPLAVSGISPGNYLVKIVKEGYADWESGLIKIIPNERKVVQAELKEAEEKEGIEVIKEEIAKILKESAVEEPPSSDEKDLSSRYTVPEEIITPPAKIIEESEPALIPPSPKKEPVALPKEEKLPKTPKEEKKEAEKTIKTAEPETLEPKTPAPPVKPSPEPKLEPAKIEIDSEPQGAKVYLKDEYQGKTPLTITGRLSWQPYMLKITYPGYSDKELIVSVGPGQNYRTRVALERWGGFLNLTSIPLKVKVYLDGRLVGETPIENLGITEGEHTLKGAKEGYPSQEMKITLEKGETRYINFVLTKKEDIQ
ncbi:MAG: PEGA domain-containing protein [bacterium]